MAQISVVRLPPAPRFGAYGAGYARPLGAVPRRLRDLSEREMLALGVFLAGMSAAGGLYLFAKGREQEAYALGIASAIVGAFVGAAQVLGE